jgi:hypothetical protein
LALLVRRQPAYSFFSELPRLLLFFLHFSLSVICTRRLVRRGGSYWAVGMNFILYAFLRDFMQNPLHDGVPRVAGFATARLAGDMQAGWVAESTAVDGGWTCLCAATSRMQN